MELVIDIETVSEHPHWDNLSAALQKHWQHKASFLKLSEVEQNDYNLSYFNRAGIYAEFGKVICIGIGIIDTAKKEVRVKTLANNNEFELLKSFIELVNKIEIDPKANITFCGHNIKEFDLPFLCRRLLIHQLDLPKCLQLSNLKPWQINHKDTLELWRFGDYKHYISLDLLAAILHVPSSKSDIDGSEVNEVYWEEKNLERIVVYCAKDIFTTALVYLKLNQKNIDNYIAINVE